jgi:hypothetical protein
MVHGAGQPLSGVRVRLIIGVLMLIGVLLWPPVTAAQGRGGVLRIGMTASDIPYTAGQPDQGGEGYRFIGYQIYDALINGDLTQGDRLPDLVPRERAELEPFTEYWDKRRLPKADRVILYPMPEATTRLAALRNGQVDWIEVPPPDGISSLRQAGFQIIRRSYPLIWTYSLNLTRPPWDNKLVRQAANYAIDREGICKSLR